MELLHVLSKINDSVWAITEPGLRTVLDVVNTRLIVGHLTADTINERINNGKGPGGKAPAKQGIGVMRIYGPILPKSDIMSQVSGATSIETLRTGFKSLIGNDMVSSIVLDIDSPGGVTDMLQ